MCQQLLQISEIIFYDKPYSPPISGTVADIALIILKENVTIGRHVLPACFEKQSARLGFAPGKNVQGMVSIVGCGGP